MKVVDFIKMLEKVGYTKDTKLELEYRPPMKPYYFDDEGDIDPDYDEEDVEFDIDKVENLYKEYDYDAIKVSLS